MSLKRNLTDGPEAVVRRHIAAFERGDLDAVLHDYAEDAVVQTHNGTIRGRGALRELFESTLQLLPPGTEIMIDTFSVAGDVVLVTWHADTDDFSVALAADTHVVRGGKIIARTSAVHVDAPAARKGTHRRSRDSRALCAASPSARYAQRHGCPAHLIRTRGTTTGGRWDPPDDRP